MKLDSKQKHIIEGSDAFLLTQCDKLLFMIYRKDFDVDEIKAMAIAAHGMLYDVILNLETYKEKE